MGKTRSVKAQKAAYPESLTMNLHAPGMSILHRAGLGGLACTLRYIERAFQASLLSDDEIPGGVPLDAFPWNVESQSITLRFGQAEGAKEFLQRLFAIAFGLKDGLVYLPGQYEHPPNLAARAELQAGLVLTFLQHGAVRTLAKEPTVILHDAAGDGHGYVRIEYRRCEWYKHQDGWKELVDKSGRLTLKPVEVIGPLSPGSVVRHVAFTAQTRIVDTPDLILPLYFALVGCLALPLSRASAALVAPDVADLPSFARDRPLITPTSARECRVAGESDAALQAMLRLRMNGVLDVTGMPACYAMRFEPTKWSTQQKSRTGTLTVQPRGTVLRREPERVTPDERRLKQFEIAMANLPPRIVIPKAAASRGSARRARPQSDLSAFWADSVVRPLIADNLAAGRAWFEGFSRLMTAIDDRGRPVREDLVYETKGLNAMTESIHWDNRAEELLVEAVHQAIAFNLGRIRQETDGDRTLSQATKNRWDRFKERLRLSLTGAKTADQCREAVCALFGRSGTSGALQSGWRELLPMLTDRRQWQKVRDLALLALASYSGQGSLLAEPTDRGETATEPAPADANT